MTRPRTSRRTFAIAVAGAAALLLPGLALAQVTFRDVDPGDVHAAGIGFVAETGISAGCGDGSGFCPSDPVTRGQMATFLQRASGNVQGIAPSVDAASVQGMNATALREGTVVGVQTFEESGSIPANGGFVTVQCPVGATVIGGGGAAGSQGYYLLLSNPTVVGWEVYVSRAIASAPDTSSATAYVICMTLR